MENKPSEPNQTTKIVAEAMLKHLAPVFPPTAQVKEIIARVRRGGEESMLELDVTKMLTSYLLEATKLRDSMQEEVKKALGK
ncbi:hypothetical protein ACR2XM_18975 [Klebsiella pneumoniae]